MWEVLITAKLLLVITKAVSFFPYSTNVTTVASTTEGSLSYKITRSGAPIVPIVSDTLTYVIRKPAKARFSKMSS